MTPSKRWGYPSKALILRMVAAARESGIDVAGFEASPNGTIRIMEARALPDTPKSAFETYMDQL